MPLYAGTIFLSAFLLFLVQPLIAKLILPWFGGSAVVWNTCMLFFQVLLLAGYAYAHWTINNLKARIQFFVHAALLFVAVVATPSLPPEWLKPSGEEAPVGPILLVLACRTSCFQAPARCCRLGIRGRIKGRYRTGSLRSRTWRASSRCCCIRC
jgi:hypothetical protein